MELTVEVVSESDYLAVAAARERVLAAAGEFDIGDARWQCRDIALTVDVLAPCDQGAVGPQCKAVVEAAGELREVLLVPGTVDDHRSPPSDLRLCGRIGRNTKADRREESRRGKHFPLPFTPRKAALLRRELNIPTRFGRKHLLTDQEVHLSASLRADERLFPSTAQ